MSYSKFAKSEIMVRVGPDHLKFPIRISCDCCGQKNSFVCSQCKVAAYCSSNCQRKNWDSHKSTCKDLKKLWGLYEACQLKMKNAFPDQTDLNKVSMDEGKVVIVNNWISMTEKLATSLQKFNTPAALKQSSSLCCKLFNTVLPVGKDIFEINLQNFMVFGMLQEAYDWMNNIVLDTLALKRTTNHFRWYGNKVWKWNYDISEFLEENEMLSAAIERPESVYFALYFIKFHYYQSCLMKEDFQHSFLLGTHGRLGAKSPARYLGGNELVLREIFSYLVPQGTFKNRSNKKSRDILMQIHKMLRTKSVHTLWRAIADGSMIITDDTPEAVFYQKIPVILKSWKKFPEGVKFMKDFFLADVGESFFKIFKDEEYY
jgi:hypothetical protein